ncbi:hypothetical protein SAMN05428967_2233 [Phyllobacterium sp. YR620]|uniref:DUF7946 domain-containing protein n=1 Tax=Phyllobacterium sp. YR620 TaxID=1881066 RepID=UPI0008825133|nr:hypothetical protein [Phyllobacterium sp. YR620]SDP46346.1 hypothetical protein SAMN05428967_2233 [Phyllobacterium sp. YR620]
MKVESIDPIRIKFEGLDAANHTVELTSLALSLQGAAKIIGASGQLALVGRTSKKDRAKAIRVLALPPQPGSYEFWVLVATITASYTPPMLPIIEAAVKTAATRVTEAVVNATIAKWAGRKKEVDIANSVAIKALEEMGHTTRAAIEMVERVALANHSAAKMLVNPIGFSAETVQIGSVSSGAFAITASDRSEIEKQVAVEIGDETTLSLKITELDLITHSCKVSVIENQQETKRIPGQITDPQISVPNNPYSSAFDSQSVISVKCKPQYSNGEIEKLFISDIASA